MKTDFLLPESSAIGIGRSLYLIGVAEDGPVMEPVQVFNMEQGENIFGDRNKGTLLRGLEQALDANQENAIFLMRISGKSAKLVIEGFSGVGGFGTLLEFRSKYGGSKYNNCSVYFTDQDDTIVFVLDMGDERIVYDFSKYETIGNFVQQINTDCRAGLHPYLASTEFELAPANYLPNNIFEKYSFEGGEDGLDLTKDELYIEADKAYNLLLGRAITAIVPLGMYFDDVHPIALYNEATYGNAVYARNRDYLGLVDSENDDRVVSFHEQLITFCKQQMDMGIMTHGVIGLHPIPTVPDDISDGQNYYFYHLLSSTAFRNRHGLSRFADGAWTDLGYYISVVCHELIYNEGTDNEYFESAAVNYAALLCSEIGSTTGKPVAGTAVTRYELSDEELDQIASLGVVTYYESTRHGLIVNSGVTAALPESELRDIANVRMLQLTMAYMNDCIEQIYEEEIDPSIRRLFIEDRIKERLTQLKELEILTGYDYSLDLNSDLTFGVIRLHLQTKYTIQGIATSATISRMGV